MLFTLMNLGFSFSLGFLFIQVRFLQRDTLAVEVGVIPNLPASCDVQNFKRRRLRECFTAWSLQLPSRTIPQLENCYFFLEVSFAVFAPMLVIYW